MVLPSPPGGIIIPAPSTGEDEGAGGNSGLIYEGIIDGQATYKKTALCYSELLKSAAFRLCFLSRL